MALSGTLATTASPGFVLAAAFVLLRQDYQFSNTVYRYKTNLASISFSSTRLVGSDSKPGEKKLGVGTRVDAKTVTVAGPGTQLVRLNLYTLIHNG